MIRLWNLLVRAALLAAVLGLISAGSASAQLLETKGISLALAKKMAAAAEAEAHKNNWNMVIVVVDADGHLIYLEKMDYAYVGSVDVAQGKARAAVLFQRPSKAFEDGIASGRNALLSLTTGVTLLEGAFNIVVDGKTIGAIGCSGALSPQDAQSCKAGLEAMGK